MELKVSLCCFLSLRTGVILIGVLGIIQNALSFVYTSTMFVQATCMFVNMTSLTDKDEPYNCISIMDGRFTLLLLLMILSQVQILVNIVLLIGVRRSSVILLKSWMAVETLTLMFTVVLITYGYYFRYKILAELIVDVFTTTICVYFLVVVYALCEEFKKGGNGTNGILPRRSFVI